MEAEREQDIKPYSLLVSGIKLAFGQTEGMTQVQLSIHVWIREGLKVLWFSGVGSGFEHIFSSPDVLGSVLCFY